MIPLAARALAKAEREEREQRAETDVNPTPLALQKLKACEANTKAARDLVQYVNSVGVS